MLDAIKVGIVISALTLFTLVGFIAGTEHSEVKRCESIKSQLYSRHLKLCVRVK